MQKEAEAHFIEAFAEKGGENHEVVVMDPHVVLLWTDNFHHFVGENLVCRHVGLPERAVEPPVMLRSEGELIVEDGPKLLFAETQVEPAADTPSPHPPAAIRTTHVCVLLLMSVLFHADLTYLTMVDLWFLCESNNPMRWGSSGGFWQFF